MSVNRSRTDTRTAARRRGDDVIRKDIERGAFIDADARAASLERARDRRAARLEARRRLRAMGEVELSFVLERRGRKHVGYFPALPSVRVTTRSKREVTQLLSRALEELTAADPCAVLQALDVDERVEGTVKFRMG